MVTWVCCGVSGGHKPACKGPYSAYYGGEEASPFVQELETFVLSLLACSKESISS